MASLDGISEKCTGVRKVEWSDSLKGEPFICLDVHYKTSYKNLSATTCRPLKVGEKMPLDVI